MAIDNLNNNHFTAAEKTAVNAAITSIENTLNPKIRTITPEDS